MRASESHRSRLQERLRACGFPGMGLTVVGGTAIPVFT